MESAKKFGEDSNDCTDTGYETITDCQKFYEWNARTQLTTWNPTPKDATKIPSGPIDYASKHWSGLIKDYYQVRVILLKQLALKNAAAGTPLNGDEWDTIQAKHAYNWTTATNTYPMQPVGNSIAVSKAMASKYAHAFAACA